MIRLSKENKKFLEEVQRQLLQKQQQEQNLINHSTDWGALEEFIQQCNNNPGLVINVTLADGTKLEIKTVKDERKINPLFTQAAYEE